MNRGPDRITWFPQPGMDNKLRAIQAQAQAKPIASIVIGRGVEWQTKPTVMLETEAISLATECRKRGLTAKVERL